MTKLFIATVVILSALLQIAVFPRQIIGLSLNLLLISLVAFIFLADFYQLLWLSLVGGLILDLNTGLDFGLNMIFYVTLVIVIKLIIKKTDITAKLAYVLIITAIASFFYNLVIISTTYKDLANANFLNLSLVIISETVLNMFLAGLSYIVFSNVLDRITNISKHKRIKI